MTKQKPDFYTRREIFILTGAISVMASVMTSTVILAGRNILLVERFDIEGRRKKTKRLLRKAGPLVLAVVVALLVPGLAFPPPAFSAQESVDGRLLKIFGALDHRQREHKARSKRDKANLEKINEELASHERGLAGLASSGLSEDEQARLGHVLTARQINAFSRSYKILAKYYNDYGALISRNLTDLGRVVKELRNSGSSSGSVKQLKAQINKQVAIGKNLRGALGELRQLSTKNPRLAGSRRSLANLMKTLDWQVSANKGLLNQRGQGALAAHGNRATAALDDALSRLSDEFVKIEAEKIALRGARENLKAALTINRLRVSQRIGLKTIPVGPGGESMPPLLAIGRFTEKINSINTRLLRSMDKDSSGVAGGAAENEFTNF